MDSNWFQELFIKEAKPALDRHGGSGSGSSDSTISDLQNTINELETKNTQLEEANVQLETNITEHENTITQLESGINSTISAIKEKTGDDNEVAWNPETGLSEQVTEVYDSGAKSEYDRFWDDYQDYGSRVNYSYEFCGSGWTLDLFKPKYDIKPRTVSGGFMSGGFLTNGDASQALEDNNIKLDTSGCIRFNNMYTYGGPRRMPEINLTSADNVSSMFYYANYLQTIDKLIFPEHDNLDTNNMFTGSPSLVNIVFEGTIGQTINMQWSKNLTVDTMKSVITHLKDHSGTDKTGKYSVVFDTTCWDRLEVDSTAPDGGTWKDYVDKLGWLT